MRDAHLAGAVNKGAGIYGVPAPTHVTTCRHSHNPHGHSAVCRCRRGDRIVKQLGGSVTNKDKLLAWLKEHP